MVFGSKNEETRWPSDYWAKTGDRRQEKECQFFLRKEQFSSQGKEVPFCEGFKNKPRNKEDFIWSGKLKPWENRGRTTIKKTMDSIPLSYESIG